MDHIVTTAPMNALIRDVYVEYKYVTSDHCPITATIDTHISHVRVKSREQGSVSKVKWDKLSELEIEQYTENTKETLNALWFNHDLFG